MGDVITQDTRLDSDLINCPGDGIVIGADNITLDLGGHTVDGEDAFPDQPWIDCEAGIVNGPWDIVPNVPLECARPGQESHVGVTIRNGVVRGFYYGVRLRGTDRNVLRRLRVSGTHTGVSLTESNNARVEASSLSGNRAGYGV